MFKKSISFIVVIAVIILGGMSLVAQETPAPFDPDANACFEGGELFGRCDTSDFNADGVVSQDEKDYAYVYGWYLLRCRVGGFFNEEFCATILPPVFAEETEALAEAPIPTSICIASGNVSYAYAPGFNNSKIHPGNTCQGVSIISVTMGVVSAGAPAPNCSVLAQGYANATAFLATVNGFDYYYCEGS
jgi:hypothetical protein